MNPTAFLAAAFFGLSVWIAMPAGSSLRRLRPAPARHHRSRIPVAWPIAIAATVATVGAAAMIGGHVAAVLACCAAMVGLCGMVLVQSASRDRQRQRRRLAVAEAAEVLAGLLRLGQVPAAALATAAKECPALREAAAAHFVAEDVADTMQKTALVPGYDDLAQIAAGWRVATETGASMQSTMQAVANRLRADQQVSGVVRAELSAPRATGRLLAALPVGGLLLGYAIGGDPIGFLTANWAGELCLLVGMALMCAGLLWTDRLADQAGQIP